MRYRKLPGHYRKLRAALVAAAIVAQAHLFWSLQVTVVNLLDKEALYNYLSTFSGTHYVTPRTITAEIGFHF